VAAVVAHRLGPKHLLTVESGRLYRSATLPPEQLADVVERYGIRTVVNLRSELENSRGSWHEEQTRLLSDLHVEQVDLPMHTGHPPSDDVLERWLELIDDETRQPILVHCEHGVIRTGMMVSVYDIEKLGRSREEVLADFELFGSDLEEPIAGRVRRFLAGYSSRTR
jgi:protein tyrosine/serine phosphatase